MHVGTIVVYSLCLSPYTCRLPRMALLDMRYVYSTGVWSDSIAICCWQALVKIADIILNTTLVFFIQKHSCPNGVHCNDVCMCGD